VETAGPGLPRATVERIAEEALRRALSDLAGASSFRGVARGVAWEIVAAGGRRSYSLDLLAETAEAMLASRIDDALWAVERTVLSSWEEFLEARPGDEGAALVAASLDAGEESLHQVRTARQQVLEELLERSTRAA